MKSKLQNELKPGIFGRDIDSFFTIMIDADDITAAVSQATAFDASHAQKLSCALKQLITVDAPEAAAAKLLNDRVDLATFGCNIVKASATFVKAMIDLPHGAFGKLVEYDAHGDSAGTLEPGAIEEVCGKLQSQNVISKFQGFASEVFRDRSHETMASVATAKIEDSKNNVRSLLKLVSVECHNIVVPPCKRRWSNRMSPRGPLKYRVLDFVAAVSRALQVIALSAVVCVFLVFVEVS